MSPSPLSVTDFSERSNLAAMGERTTVDLTPSAHRQLAKTLDTAADRLADRLLAALKPTTATPEVTDPCPGMHGEPFHRYLADTDSEQVAFIDDRRMIRWVPDTEVSGVPAGWHPLLLGPAVVKR